jgi:hypothetical protein
MHTHSAKRCQAVRNLTVLLICLNVFYILEQVGPCISSAAHTGSDCSPDALLRAFVESLQHSDTLSPPAAALLDRVIRPFASQMEIPIPMASSTVKHSFFEVSQSQGGAEKTGKG